MDEEKAGGRPGPGLNSHASCVASGKGSGDGTQANGAGQSDTVVFLQEERDTDNTRRQEGVKNGKTKTRKPYTMTKQRERWTDEEHRRFVEGIKLHGRQWRKIEEYIGTKTSVQIRSHAQKFFDKLEKQQATGTKIEEGISIPPPRPKRKPSRPYPRKRLWSGDQANHQPSSLPPGALLLGDPNAKPTEGTIAAVAAAASAAAAAAAAAVVAAAGDEIKNYLQMNPPQGFPFFGVPPTLLAYVATMQAPRNQMVPNWQEVVERQMKQLSPTGEPFLALSKAASVGSMPMPTPVAASIPERPVEASAVMVSSAPHVKPAGRSSGIDLPTTGPFVSELGLLPPSITSNFQNWLNWQGLPPHMAIALALWQFVQGGTQQPSNPRARVPAISAPPPVVSSAPVPDSSEQAQRRAQRANKLRQRRTGIIGQDDVIGGERKRRKLEDGSAFPEGAPADPVGPLIFSTSTAPCTPPPPQNDSASVGWSPNFPALPHVGLGQAPAPLPGYPTIPTLNPPSAVVASTVANPSPPAAHNAFMSLNESCVGSSNGNTGPMNCFSGNGGHAHTNRTLGSNGGVGLDREAVHSAWTGWVAPSQTSKLVNGKVKQETGSGPAKQSDTCQQQASLGRDVSVGPSPPVFAPVPSEGGYGGSQGDPSALGGSTNQPNKQQAQSGFPVESYGSNVPNTLSVLQNQLTANPYLQLYAAHITLQQQMMMQGWRQDAGTQRPVCSAPSVPGVRDANATTQFVQQLLKNGGINRSGSLPNGQEWNQEPQGDAVPDRPQSADPRT